MKKRLSIEEIVRSAREDALDDFKQRFKQKWLFGIPAFRWSELQITDELKTSICTSNPTVWLLRDGENLNFDDKIWREEDVLRIISFDHIENEEVYPSDDAFEVWLSEDIECGLGLLNPSEREDVILCFNAGSGSLSKYWDKAFLERLEK